MLLETDNRVQTLRFQHWLLFVTNAEVRGVGVVDDSLHNNRQAKAHLMMNGRNMFTKLNSEHALVPIVELSLSVVMPAFDVNGLL